MSVKSEFVRIVGDAIACLRELDSAPAGSLAADLERARDAASHDLSGAAARVLELWETAAPTAALAGGADACDRLDAAAARARAVSKVILGR